MNKCLRCGAEFEEEACDTCKNKVTENIVCPKCGKRIPADVKFCPYCECSVEDYIAEAYGFDGKMIAAKNAWKEAKLCTGALRREKKVGFALDLICTLAPFVLLVFYALASLLLMAVPVAKLDGMFGNETLDNVYLPNELTFYVPGFNVAIIMMFSGVLLSLGVAMITGFTKLSAKIKYAHIGKLRVAMIFDILTVLPYLFSLTTSVTGMIMIFVANDGYDFISLHAGLILMIIFTVMMLAVTAAAIIGKVICDVKLPEFSVDSEEEEKTAYRAYLVEKKNLNRPSKFAVWFKSWRSLIISFLVIVTIGVALVLPFTTKIKNDVYIHELKKIEYGASEEVVLDVLGEPFVASRDTDVWVWYGYSAKHKVSKLVVNEAKMEYSFLEGDFGKVEELGKENEELLKELKKTEFSYTAVGFKRNASGERVVAAVYYITVRDGAQLGAVASDKPSEDGGSEVSQIRQNIPHYVRENGWGYDCGYIMWNTRDYGNSGPQFFLGFDEE